MSKYKIVVTKVDGTGFQTVKGHSWDDCAAKSVNIGFHILNFTALSFKIHDDILKCATYYVDSSLKPCEI